MGRRSKDAQKSRKHESTNLSAEVKEVKPENNKPSLTSVDENPESSILLEPLEANISKMSSQERAKKIPATVRRSGRLQIAIMPTENQCIERIIEEITVSGSEKEDEPADEELLEPTMNGKDLDGKIDYLVQLVVAQQKTMDELSSRVIGKTSVDEGFSTGDFTYKSLYIDSQKRVEALTEENNRLHKQLEFSRGKIEVYEKGILTLDKVKDVFFQHSSLAKAREAITGDFIAPEDIPETRTSKRKRPDKESGKN